MFKNVNGVNVPMSEAEIVEFNAKQVEWDNDATERASKKVIADRSDAYPPIGDQLDAILKYLESAGVPDGSEIKGIITSWRAVKGKYPLPS